MGSEMCIRDRYQGIAYVITNAKTISSLPPAFKAIGQGTIFHPSLTYATIFMIVAGKIANCVAGVLIMGLLANGMQLAGLNTYYQYVAKGAIMLLVMWFDAFQIKRRAIASNKRKEERASA